MKLRRWIKSIILLRSDIWYYTFNWHNLSKHIASVFSIYVKSRLSNVHCPLLTETHYLPSFTFCWSNLQRRPLNWTWHPLQPPLVNLPWTLFLRVESNCKLVFTDVPIWEECWRIDISYLWKTHCECRRARVCRLELARSVGTQRTARDSHNPQNFSWSWFFAFFFMQKQTPLK